MSALRQEIARRSLGEGFSAARIVTLEADAAQARHLHDFIAQGRNGDMTWLAETAGRRASPLALWPEARTAIVLAQTRNFLAGDRLSYADLAAAAHLSAIDYLGDVPWSEDDGAKHWYARVKSRPSFRGILADRLPGLTPSPVYADLDF